MDGLTLALEVGTRTTLALAAPITGQETDADGTPTPLLLMIVFAALALAPFVLIMLTSFIKISVVLSILRNALGTQQIPPNQVITGLSLILTVFIMAPVVKRCAFAAGDIADTGVIFSEKNVPLLVEAAQRGERAFARVFAAQRERR
jgi:type III secretion protein R